MTDPSPTRGDLRDEAVVLHVRPYGESDAIVALFARAHGRISLFARGVRSAKRKRTAPLQPAYVISLELARKPNAELYTARAVDVLRRHEPLSHDLTRLAAAHVLLEDCRELFHEGDADAAVYEQLRAALAALETDPPLEVVNGFEHGLIDALGYGGQTESGAGIALFRRRTQSFEQLRGRHLPAREFLSSLVP